MACVEMADKLPSIHSEHLDVMLLSSCLVPFVVFWCVVFGFVFVFCVVWVGLVSVFVWGG